MRVAHGFNCSYITASRFVRGTVAIGLITCVSAVNAQSSPDAPPLEGTNKLALEEIVVTAQRRSENLQDVPISVTAVSAASLQKANVTSLAGLSILAPSLDFADEAAWSQPHLRGIGTSATGPGVENPVAVYIDGVYQASMIGGAANLNNVQDVEVINGPQGTLFGRNATGGLIQIRTLDPSHELGGSLSAGYGNYDTTSASAYVTGGITDTLAANFSLDFSNQGRGYGTNIATRTQVDKTQNLFTRSKLLFEPNDDMKFTLSGNYAHVDFVPALPPVPGTQPVGGSLPGLRPYDIDGLYDPDGHVEAYGGSLTADFDLHPLHFLSITAYQVTESRTIEDSLTPDPAFSTNIDITEPHKQFSQELQLSSPMVDRLTWTAGLYYFHETALYDPTFLYGGLFGANIYYFTTSKTNSYAAYAQGTYEVLPSTHLTTGIRYTTEERSIEIDNPVFSPDGTISFGTETTSDSKNYHAPTWRVALDHSFTQDVLAYVSYNRGYKSGGFNPAALPADAYNPEKLDAYEVGLKTQTPDHRFRFNAAGYLYHYDNIQVQSFESGILNITNGAKARLYGADFDGDAAVTQNFSLHAGVSLLRTKFTSFPNAPLTTPDPLGGTDYTTFNASGQRLPFAPELTLSIAANYTIPTSLGKLDLNAAYNHNSGWNAAPDGRLHQDAFDVLNGQVGFTLNGGKYEIDAYGKNLLNQAYALDMIEQSFGDNLQWAPPRTYGVLVKMKF
jgi:iron complex outermembrane recepter protein